MLKNGLPRPFRPNREKCVMLIYDLETIFFFEKPCAHEKSPRIASEKWSPAKFSNGL